VQQLSTQTNTVSLDLTLDWRVRDPVTLMGTALTLAAVGALAGWIPARRASRIDPAEVLRNI
jgi:ABC-type lipoprotein release transport system permease subunit